MSATTYADPVLVERWVADGMTETAIAEKLGYKHANSLSVAKRNNPELKLAIERGRSQHLLASPAIKLRAAKEKASQLAVDRICKLLEDPNERIAHTDLARFADLAKTQPDIALAAGANVNLTVDIKRADDD